MYGLMTGLFAWISLTALSRDLYLILFMCKRATFDAMSSDSVMNVDFALHWLLTCNMY